MERQTILWENQTQTTACFSMKTQGLFYITSRNLICCRCSKNQTYTETAQRAPFGYPQLDENCAVTARKHSSTLKASHLNCISSVLEPDWLPPSTSVSWLRSRFSYEIHFEKLYERVSQVLHASTSSVTWTALGSAPKRWKEIVCCSRDKDICCPLISYRNEKNKIIEKIKKARSRFIDIPVPQYQRSDRLQRVSLYFLYNTHPSVHKCCSAKEGKDRKEKAL